MKVLILEDEPLAVEHLTRMLRNTPHKLEILPAIDTVRASIEWFQTNPEPDLCFMDIRLADGLSFNIFQEVSISTPIIFTTAYDNYTLQAFKVNSIDYLLKPIAREELEAALAKYAKIFQQPQKVQAPQTVDFEQMRKLLLQSTKPAAKRRFLVKKGEQLHAIPTIEILFFYAEDKVTFLIDRSGRRFMVEYTLTDIEQQVSKEDFFRVNRKYLTRFDAIKSMHTFSARKIKLNLSFPTSDDVFVSRERIQRFKEWLDS